MNFVHVLAVSVLSQVLFLGLYCIFPRVRHDDNDDVGD